ncbi:ATP synthase F1 subunit epsilon [Candidatus Zinderia endosymbiont of Aphrophora alni]|uniref:ATP synthase F1 subunit epsilon n=1 Tax=Candidatus Zinderia endosymbiont of Aphrophora alni TaxID=3077951 RepID=UPI0030CEEC93
MQNKKKSFIKINILSVKEKIFSGLVKFIVVPCTLGQIGIFPNHIPFISFIVPGIIKIKFYEKKYNEFIFVFGGFIEIRLNKVNILVDIAVRNAHLDKNRSIIAEKLSKNIKNKNKLSLIQANLNIVLSKLSFLEKYKK